MADCHAALTRLGVSEVPAKWVDSVFDANFVGTKGKKSLSRLVLFKNGQTHAAPLIQGAYCTRAPVFRAMHIGWLKQAAATSYSVHAVRPPARPSTQAVSRRETYWCVLLTNTRNVRHIARGTQLLG